jgi:hypothetical protein
MLLEPDILPHGGLVAERRELNDCRRDAWYPFRANDAASTTHKANYRRASYA